MEPAPPHCLEKDALMNISSSHTQFILEWHAKHLLSLTCLSGLSSPDSGKPPGETGGSLRGGLGIILTASQIP